MSTESELRAFGEESFDHVPEELMMKIVKSRKPYDLQDVADMVWFSKKRAPQNMNIRSSQLDGIVNVWMGQTHNGWRPKLIPEIKQRMVEIMCQHIADRLHERLSDEECQWLASVPEMTDKRYKMLMDALHRTISWNQ
jgi:hypothetical protein